MDRIEEMLSGIGELLGKREQELLERISLLEKKVEELEARFEEMARLQNDLEKGLANVWNIPVLEEDMEKSADGAEGAIEFDFEDESDDWADEYQEGDVEEVLEEEDSAGEFDLQSEDGTEEEIAREVALAEEDAVAEDILEEAEDESWQADEVVQVEDIEEVVMMDEDEVVELETCGPDSATEVCDGKIENVISEEMAQQEDEGEKVLLMDKAKPDWYDWEVDIPGPHIDDVWDGIGLNDRMLFQRELFYGNEDDFRDTVAALNRMERLVQAMEYIRERYPDWDEESDEVYRFYMTVRRRFNK